DEPVELRAPQAALDADEPRAPARNPRAHAPRRARPRLLDVEVVARAGRRAAHTFRRRPGVDALRGARRRARDHKRVPARPDPPDAALRAAQLAARAREARG